jgi:hypothetical protein
MKEYNFTIKDIEASSEDAKNQLALLASSMYSKAPDEITMEEIQVLLDMELAAIPTKLSVNVDEVRRTKLQFCTWRGGLAAEIATEDLKMIARNLVTTTENPVDGFIKASSYIKAFIISKLGRTENLLRQQMNVVMKKDGLELIPDSRFEGKV